MLARAEKKGIPPNSPLRTELSEVREITHNTLEKMRSLSHMLHPTVLDDYGLAKGIEWYAEVFQRQTGIKTTTAVSGPAIRITGPPAIHCFRIVQEALNNAAKHSGTKTAEVQIIFSAEKLTVNIRDFGRGMEQSKRLSQPGLGLIAMRERAELLSGELKISSTANVGTTVTVSVPLQDEYGPETIRDETTGELVSQQS
jgi:signal transduction histidine kinase